MSGAVKRPDGHTDDCQDCETKETVYSVKLSVVITLNGAPNCHTKAIVWENVMAWLRTMDEGQCGEESIDAIDVIEIRDELIGKGN